jgi:NAD(P)-dependent dehydrogenase (short-subunit alcohol dehydrogenase family)
MGRLQDKVILVTGAAGAIGSALMIAIAREGAVPVGTDLYLRVGVEHALDVTSEDDWRRVIAAVDGAVGRLDGLVNAAGIAVLGTVEDTDYATWKRVMTINLDGTFLGCKYAFPLLKRQGGTIVNLSSVAGIIGGYNMVAYNASKGGVRLLTKGVALHGSRLNPQIRCNSVHPAFLDSPMVDAAVAASQFPDSARARTHDPRHSARAHGDGRGSRRALRLPFVG